MIDIVAAVIAGGKSVRYGRSKLVAGFHGERLVDRALYIASRVSQRTMLIIGEQTPPSNLDCPVYRDIIADCGPVGGIHAALVHAQAEWVAVMPVDMPLLSPRVYELLATCAEKGRPAAARSAFGLQAMVSVWPSAAAPGLEKLLKRGERKVGRVLHLLDGVVVPVAQHMDDYDETWFANVNTPDDLKKLTGG